MSPNINENKDQVYSKEIKQQFQKLIASDNILDAIQAVYALGRCEAKDEALDALINGLVVPDSEVKLAILDTISQTDFFGADIVRPISELLKDEDTEVRLHAAEVLGAMKDKRAVIPLINALKDLNSEVRHKSMAALAVLGYNIACEPLGECTKSENWEDRFNAVDALGMLADPSSLVILSGLLDDPHPKVRENAALSVVHYEEPIIKEKLIMLLDDVDPPVRGAAAYTLGELKTREAVQPLLDFLKSDIDDLVVIAVESLAKIRDPISIPALIELLEYCPKEITGVVSETLDFFDGESLMDPFVQALMQDRKIEYLKGRFIDTRHSKIPFKLINKLKLPVWVEQLILELMISKQENSKKEKAKENEL